MARNFTVNFVNNAGNPGSVVLFQRHPGDNPHALALAWFAKYTYPNTRVAFRWTTEPCFVWSDVGQLVPGIVAGASQTVNADPVESNLITLTYNRGFNFVNQRQGQQAGTLSVILDATIPGGMASVGIGMSGQPTILAPAQPNFNMLFRMSPQYWIAYGDYEAGEVLNVDAIANATQIAFPGNIYAMDATLNIDGSWTIAPTHLSAEV